MDLTAPCILQRTDLGRVGAALGGGVSAPCPTGPLALLWGCSESSPTKEAPPRP